MNRRQFIQHSGAMGFFPLAMGGLPLKNLLATTPYQLNPCSASDRSVVIIFLNGANDIINTAVPLSQFSSYINHRPDIYIPESNLIQLDSNLSDDQALGLHPRIKDFKHLYDDGLLAMVQRVGYDLPNRSHFKSTENWFTGSGGALQNQKDGWAARFLNNRFPGYQGVPFEGEPDPLGLLFGNTISTGFHSAEEHRLEINLSGQDPAGFYTLISSLGGAPIPNIPTTEQGDLLVHLETISNSVNVYAQRISDTFNQGINMAEYPTSSLGGQLKTIARMLNGGSRTKIFMASKGGWDNHNELVSPGNSLEGRHADLLGDLGASVYAFQQDLKSMGLDQKVLTVIFSEFGRKVIQNGSYGTDHGTLSTMYLVGSGVAGGVYGSNINLDDQDRPGAPNPNQIEYDYRTVFASVLQDWLGADNEALQSTFLQSQYYSDRPVLINPGSMIDEACYFQPQVPVTCACIQVKVILEGFYESGLQKMHTKLLERGVLPQQQPYNIPPFSYEGAESVEVWPEDTVDWLLVELRAAEDLSQIIARKAALLGADGLLMELDGTKGLRFEELAEGSYHLAIYHRNHIAILGAEPILLDVPGFIYDFTNSEFKAEGYQQLKRIGNVWAMYAGDPDQNQAINSADFNLWKESRGQNPSYSQVDLNADGTIDQLDYQAWLENRSKLGHLK